MKDFIEDRTYINQALILACVSLFVEFYIHVVVSLCFGTGYLIYFLNPKFLLVFMWSAQMSDVGGIFFGKFFGKNSFANTISPSKTWEGVFGAIFTSILT